MTAIKLGLRYERLLILAGPMSFATLMVLFIAIASVSQKEKFEARCLELGAATFAEKKDSLQAAWDDPDRLYSASYYKLALNKAWIYSNHRSIGDDCYDIIDSQIDGKASLSPSDIIEKFQLEANALKRTPLQFHDVEIPERATVNILGTDVKIGLMTFTQVTQVALAPLLLLWLGSLYTTRLRESLQVASASTLSEVFPHSVNIYSIIKFPPLKKPTLLYIIYQK
jgi:hypothetical protein